MSFELKILNSIHQLKAQQWNQLCGFHYPFLRHEFLSALEDSNCTSLKTGWQAAHVTVYQHSKLICIMPMYQKTNSNGEYVFDWDWANAYESHQLDYYPKLLTAIPFSPCYGPRIASCIPLTEILPFIVEQLKELCVEFGFSGWHGLFFSSADAAVLSEQSLLTREGIQYHWQNKNYLDFNHYLASFNSRKRKNINRERRIVSEQNVEIQAIEGANISPKLLTEFYYCYHLTYLKRGRQGYLNLEFFQLLLEKLAQHIVLFVAIHKEKTVACAWCFKNTDPQDSVLYGRYWGCLDNFDSLHFETCYYQGLEYCIANNIQRFDPGAQGEHKIQRGFEPITTYSNHYIAHPQFSDAIEDFLKRERAAIQEHKQHLTTLLPFKQEQS
ncbi:MAG: GNAT family N-acetyltransferase [Oceanospirillaceae bacterium]